ncbi:hypothetical protein ACFXJO_25040 [Streptomyces lavendulae]|uniref:hypothetical protein n=1 Tax=Streptomyces lavendulae TaxID=1914 RepID=UPI0036A83A5B
MRGRRKELAAVGMRYNGIALDEEGKTLLWFADKDGLHGVRLEFVSPVPQPIVDEASGARGRARMSFPG